MLYLDCELGPDKEVASFLFDVDFLLSGEEVSSNPIKMSELMCETIRKKQGYEYGKETGRETYQDLYCRPYSQCLSILFMKY